MCCVFLSFSLNAINHSSLFLDSSLILFFLNLDCTTLLYVQFDFFTMFKSQHLVEVGLMSFSNLKPYFVKKQKYFNTCCKYHQIMIEIKVGFCNMHAFVMHNGDDSRCSCGCKIICNLLCIALVGRGSINYQINQHTSKENLKLWENTLSSMGR
jgi:hypothetical protein